VTDGRYLFVAIGPVIYAVDSVSGARLARYQGSAAFYAPPTLVGVLAAGDSGERLMLVGDVSGNLHALSFWPTRKEFSRKWTWDAGEGGIYGAVCVAEDMAFFGSDGGVLYALRATDPTWSNTETAWAYATGGQIKAAPAYWRGLVYFISGDRWLYAAEAQTGLLRWQFSTGRGLGEAAAAADAVASRTVAAPVVANDKVYVARSRYVYAVSADSGLLRWRFSADGDVIGSPSVSDRRLVVATHAGSIYCLHANTGEQLWRWRTVGGESFGAPPVATSDVAVVRSHWGTLYALELATGKARWIYKLKEIPATGALQAGAITGRPPALQRRLLAPGGTVPVRPGGAGFGGGRAPVGGRGGARKAEASLQVAARPQSPTASGVQYFQRSPRRGGLSLSAIGARGGTQPTRATPTQARAAGTVGAPATVAAPALRLATLLELISPAPIFWGERLYVMSNDYTLCAFGPEGVDSALPLVLGAHVQVPGGDDFMYAYQLPVAAPEAEIANPITINGQAPIYLSFYLYDQGSGIDPDSIRLTMNGNAVETKFRPDDGTVWFILKHRGEKTLFALADGDYSFLLSAADWSGNTLTKKTLLKVSHAVPAPRGLQAPRPVGPAGYGTGYGAAGLGPAVAGAAGEPVLRGGARKRAEY